MPLIEVLCKFNFGLVKAYKASIIIDFSYTHIYMNPTHFNGLNSIFTKTFEIVDIKCTYK